MRRLGSRYVQHRAAAGIRRQLKRDSFGGLEHDDQRQSRGDSVKSGGPLWRPTESLEGLSIDFNPRDLIETWTPLGAADPRAHLQAIYVPTKGRIQHVKDLLDGLDGHNVPVFLVPSCQEDIPLDPAWQERPVQQLCFRDHTPSLSVLQSLRSAANPLFTTPATTWDLPLKRNYALWHARENGFRKILLVDDDIRGLDDALFRAGAAALRQWIIAGVFIDKFPDTSVIGHVELAVGERVIPFLSGSCLFVRCDAPVGFFPQIYNEDWIFMAPHMACGKVCSFGSIRQEPYDPFSDSSRPVFQEPGEIIADGLFALLACGHYGDRFHQSAWEAVLSKRREWLTVLADQTRNPLHRAAVETARALCERITALDCAEYVNDLEYDRQTWSYRLEELT